MNDARRWRRALASACFATAIALVLWSAAARPREGTSRQTSLAERLLGPIAGLAASVEWIRVDSALELGRPELAYARAALALDLAPGDSGGWIYLAHHFVYERASALREPDRASRARWVQAALDLLARGELCAREPGKLAFKRAVVFESLALMEDDERPWPGARRDAWLEAARAFDRAARAGEPVAAEAAEAARAAAVAR